MGNKFKIGDRVRIRHALSEFNGRAATVVSVGPIMIGVSFAGIERAFYEDALVPAAPDFKVGDRVKIKTGSCTGQFATVRAIIQQSCWPFTVHGDDGHHYAYAGDSLELVADEPLLSDAEQDALKNAARADWKNWATRVIAHGGSTQYGKTAVSGRDKAVGPDWTATVEVKAVGQPNQALRYNASKPESDYIFTYEGGIDAAFGPDFEYYDTLIAMRAVYVAERGVAMIRATSDLIEALRSDARDAGDSIIRHIAITNRLGSVKYEPGNYLRGANWRQYFQSAVRHAEKLANGEEFEPDPVLVKIAKEKGLYTEDMEAGFPHRGNFFFNVLCLCHCITTGIGTDDRIRRPA